jgi:hypothetical protein
VGDNTFDAESAVAARKAILAPQLSAHLQQKPIAAGERQVGDLDRGGILVAACATHNDDGDMPFRAGSD